MTNQSDQPGAPAKAARYVARPALKAAIYDDGYRMDYLAGMLGVHPSQMTRIVAGTATVSAENAGVLTALFGRRNIDVLFEVARPKPRGRPRADRAAGA